MTPDLRECPISLEASSSDAMQGFELTPGRYCVAEIISACKARNWSIQFTDEESESGFKLELLKERDVQGWKLKFENKIFYMWFYFYHGNPNIMSYGVVNSKDRPFPRIPMKQFFWMSDVYQKYFKFNKLRGVSRASNLLAKKMALGPAARFFGVYQEALLKKEHSYGGIPRDVCFYTKNYY